MNHILQPLQNIPVTGPIIQSFYPDLSCPSKKVIALEKTGEIIRIKRGLYVVSPVITGKLLSKELIANHLYAPSYVSMYSALRYYGLTPEAVYTTQSMTIKHSRSFHTALGYFQYTALSREIFSLGITSIVKEGYAFLMATPEKALCDLIANSPKVNLRYLKDVETYLEGDLRFDMDAFLEMNVHSFEDYVPVGKKSESIKTLIKYLKKRQ